MTGEDLVSAVEALKATEIKAELAVFGATTAGVKAQLVERLTRCYELKREGKDVKAELRRRTLDRLGEAEEAKAEAMRRRDARRRRAGGYERAAAAAAAKAPGGVLKAPNLKRSRGKGVPVLSRGEKNAASQNKSTDFVADVDLDEDKEDASEKYKLDNPLTGRRKLNVVRRDLDRQGAFQDTMTSEGWYMVAVPETREERAAELITALSGTPRVGGVVIDAWTPRAPAVDFAVSESDARGKSRLDLLRLVPGESEGSEKPFPGFILLKLSGMNQKLLGALEEVYPFKGFAVGGITRYGNTRKQKSEAPRTVPDAQLEQMMRACEPLVVSDEAFAEMLAEKKAREEEERTAAASLEHAMGEMEVASPEEVAAMRGDAAAESAEVSSASAAAPSEERASTAPPGAQTVEVHQGPFKGFKGYVTARRDDGSVDATLTIFGRETAVSLEASEFAFS
jgi:transcription antitermination factor NusG